MDAIKIKIDKPLIWRMGDIYDEIARKRETTYSRVERQMRTAIAPAIKNIQKKYNYYGKFTNQTFLNLIKYKLI